MAKSKLREEYQKEAKKLERRIERAEKRGFIFSDDIRRLIETPKRVTRKAIEKIKDLKRTNLTREAIGYKTGDNKGTVVSAATGINIERHQSQERRKYTIHKTLKQKHELEDFMRKVEEETYERELTDYDEPSYIWYDDYSWFDEPDEAQIVVESFESKLESISPQHSSKYQQQKEQEWLDDLTKAFKEELRNIGYHEMAIRLQAHADEINDIIAKASLAYVGKSGMTYGYSSSYDYPRFLSLIKGRVLTLDESLRANDMQYSDNGEDYLTDGYYEE